MSGLQRFVVKIQLIFAKARSIIQLSSDWQMSLILVPCITI